MTVDSMSQLLENTQSIYTIIMALAIAEAFNQAIKENKHPETERQATTLTSWFDCIHPSRIPSLIVFLLLAIPFFQGNQKYLYLQYTEPLHQAIPIKTVSALWLNFDCLTFSLQSGLFFVMSRSLSAKRWQQFYATIVLLMVIDCIWVLMEMWHGANVPTEWLWQDLRYIIGITVVILVDWFFVPYERDKKLNVYCYYFISAGTILALAYDYFCQFDYLID